MISNRLTDFDEIWHADASQPSASRQLKQNFEILKIEDGVQPPF